MIAENAEKIRGRIAHACVRSGRDPSEVTLVAVSKTFPWTAVTEAVGAGIRDFGENYVQELLRKRAFLAGEHLRWHFIGHLQSNKVKYIAEWVHLIHAVDSVRLAKTIDELGKKAGRVLNILVEVNTTAESSKFGVQPGHVVDFVKGLAAYTNLDVAGLMTIGAFLPDPESSRPMFRKLRLLKEEIAGLGQPNVSMKHLSMGMTGDFEVAIEEGATIVRVGTAIFGSRAGRT